MRTNISLPMVIQQMKKNCYFQAFVLLVLSVISPCWADQAPPKHRPTQTELQVRIASAANFQLALKKLSLQFEQKTNYKLLTSYASTGQLFAQISNGAPFDVFLSADSERANRLIDNKLAVSGSGLTYAVGELVLWSADPAFAFSDDRAKSKEINCTSGRIALANPKLAPYGKAALEALSNIQALQHCKRLIYGQSVAQVMQFIASRNVTFGFVARAQLTALPDNQKGAFWLIPQRYYSRLEQKAVLLTRAQYNPAAIAFLDYLNSSEARQIIEDQGYSTISKPVTKG